MAEFRQIYTRIWKDNWFSDLDMDAKMLFIYLFSNERASVSGIYELPLKYISFETGIEKPRLIELLDQFKADGKVQYEDGIIWVVNLRKYNETTSPKVQTRLTKDVSCIPDSDTLKKYCEHYGIPYPYRINTHDEKNSRDRDGDGNIKEGANAPFSAPLAEPEPQEKPPYRDQLWDLMHGKTLAEQRPDTVDVEWLAADVLDLGRAFLEATRLPPPRDKSTRGYWIKELRAMRLMDELTQDDIRRAVRKMRDSGGIIKSPESVRTIALDMRAANGPVNFAEVY